MARSLSILQHISCEPLNIQKNHCWYKGKLQLDTSCFTLSSYIFPIYLNEEVTLFLFLSCTLWRSISFSTRYVALFCFTFYRITKQHHGLGDSVNRYIYGSLFCMIFNITDKSDPQMNILFILCLCYVSVFGVTLIIGFRVYLFYIFFQVVNGYDCSDMDLQAIPNEIPNSVQILNLASTIFLPFTTYFSEAN